MLSKHHAPESVQHKIEEGERLPVSDGQPASKVLTKEGAKRHLHTGDNIIPYNHIVFILNSA